MKLLLIPILILGLAGKLQAEHHVEVNRDKPARLYLDIYALTLQASSRSTSDSYQDSAGNATNSSVAPYLQWSTSLSYGTTIGRWQDSKGGSSHWEGVIENNSSAGTPTTNRAYLNVTYTTNVYPNIVVASQTASDGITTSPFEVNQEHVKVATPVVDSSGTYLAPPQFGESAYHLQIVADTGLKQAQAKMRLDTGGKARPNTNNVYVISGSAQQIQCTKAPIPILRNPAPPGPLTIPPQQIKILGRPLAADGTLAISAGGGQSIDVTPQVAGLDYFKFLIILQTVITNQ